MCAITQRNKIGKEKGDQKQRKSASGLPLDQQIRALFFLKNRSSGLNDSNKSMHRTESKQLECRTRGQPLRQMESPVQFDQNSSSPLTHATDKLQANALLLTEHTQLQKVLIALDHLGFKSYYIQVQKDATKVFQFTSEDTYDEL